MTSKRFRMAVIQLAVGANKSENIKRAINFIKVAKENGSSVIALPECFNSPYGTKYFPQYAEPVSSGETCQALSKAAKENGVFIIGGSIPESDGNRYFNTCTVWNPDGMLIGKHRKVHLFDINIPGGVKFRESDILTPGDRFTTFNTDISKIGIGICYDIRFEEMSRIYKNQGCDVLVYPGAFNMTTGPLHWELLLRSRAVDNQLFIAGAAPAQDKTADYISWGHSLVVDPWGKVISKTEFAEDVIYADIDLTVLEDVRRQIPITYQSRTDLYETVDKTTSK